MRDVESLIDQVPNPQVRKLTRDAWRCYQAGVHRAAVISTWTAVNDDIIGKIVWLAEEGDSEAQKFRENLRRVQQSGLTKDGVVAMQKIEQGLLETAVKFELLDRIGERGLNRIREDRNLCVHTSLNSSDEPYEPGEENARAHLVTALTLLLNHPPLGDSRLRDRFLAYVCDPHFVLSREHILASFHDRIRSKGRLGLIKLAAKHALLELPAEGRLPDIECADRMAKILVLFASRDRAAVREAVAKVMDRFAGLDAEQKLRTLIRLGDGDFFWDSLQGDQHEYLKALVANQGVHKIRPGDQVTRAMFELLSLLSLVGSEQAREQLPELENRFNLLDTHLKMSAAILRPARYFVPVVLATLQKATSGFVGGKAGKALAEHAQFLDLDTLRRALQAWGGNYECLNGRYMRVTAVQLFHATEHLGRERIEVFGEFLTALSLHSDESDYTALAETLQTNEYTPPAPSAAGPEENPA
ncbi:MULTISPECIES: hypothetical protein [Actinosynnema]|uniref:hypothetical protein n=1 Tax=Actinosynnema TaxID=40566 RepID=UPI0020A282B4|nr:hypothetical protein [Actinosynnema pretiosum]MCP2097345.1 hypothetical protein [Actinosynnema pretiosum]